MAPRADARGILLLLAALWLAVFVYVGVRHWNAIVADSRTDVGAWGEE